MLQSVRRRAATAALAFASLFPSLNKVSFMGVRDASRSAVVAMEAASVKLEPVAEKVAQSSSGIGGKVAVGSGVSVVAGGAAFERTCASVSRTAPAVGLEARAGATIGREIGEAAPSVARASSPGIAARSVAEAEDATMVKSLPNRPPSFNPGIIVSRVEEPGRLVARRAVATADLKFVTAAGAAHEETALARLILQHQLHEESIRLTESLITRLNVTELQSSQSVAAAFRSGLGDYAGFHTTLDASTGIVRMNVYNNGVVLAAEFNLYSAAQTAATVLARSNAFPPESDANLNRVGPKG